MNTDRNTGLTNPTPISPARITTAPLTTAPMEAELLRAAE